MQKALRLAGDTHSLDDFVAALNRGDMQAHCNEGAIILTEIAVAPRRRYLHVLLSAGELQSVLALIPTVKAFANKHKCEFARAFVRPGMEAHLKAAGWKRKMIQMEYEGLDYGKHTQKHDADDQGRIA